MLVILDFIQSTQVSKSVKSNDPKRPSFTNLSTLFWDICPNLLCHKILDVSLTLFLLLVHTRDTADLELKETFNLNNPSIIAVAMGTFPFIKDIPEALNKVL